MSRPHWAAGLWIVDGAVVAGRDNGGVGVA